MLILSNDDVRRLVSLDDATALVRDALTDAGRGEALSRDRANLAVPSHGAGREHVLKTWDAALPRAGVSGTRVSSSVLAIERDAGRVFARPPEPGARSAGAVLVFDVATGAPLAWVQDAHLARLAVSAASAVAVDALARRDATVLAMLGAGRQARLLVPLVAAVRPLRDVRVFHPIEATRDATATELRAAGVPARAVASPHEALVDAEIVATASSSPFAIFDASSLRAGAHVSLSRPSEAPPDLFAAASVLVTAGDDPSTTLSIGGAGDLFRQRAPAPGGVDPARVVALERVLAGSAPGRARDEDTTVYGALSGHLPGVVFLALAAAAARRAASESGDREVPAEWLLQSEAS